MQPIKTYDYLTLARRRIHDWVRPLSAADYTRTFAIGPGSLARTLTHTMMGEWLYVERMEQRPVPPYDQWTIQDQNPPTFATLEQAWAEQAARTRAALSAVQDWTREFEYRVVGDQGPQIVTVCAADIFTQLVLHEVHHRAQVMNMLRQLGVTVDDLDYNALMYKRRPASS